MDAESAPPSQQLKSTCADSQSLGEAQATGLAKREAMMSYLDGSGSTTKKKSPTSAAIVREGLKANLSAAEATSQLKVLCRKFAALTEKVKEETRVREEADREVRRLRAIVEGNNAPVVASCRAESQAYMRELKDAHDKSRQELRFEKEKNAMLVSKALELEKEKNALLAANQSAASSSSDSGPSRQAQWDKEQVQKIQMTLRMTIDELQDELGRKEEELESYKEQAQRERGRVKQLEEEIRARETAERDAERLRHQLEVDLRDAEQQISKEQQHLQSVSERAHEDRVIRDTLEEQIETLNEVNAALEQRCNALIRRVELNANVMNDCHELKVQLRDAEIDNETLVRTIRDLKDRHFQREKELKTEIEKARDEKREVEAQVKELEAEINALRAQNSLFSEWMLVRNENALIAKKETLYDSSPFSPHQSWRAPSLVHDSTRFHSTPTSDSSGSKASRSMNSHARLNTESPQQRTATTSTTARMSRKMSTASISSSSSSSTTSSSTNADHERLRLLMSRNRELQQRLQQETLATQNLEQEITNITTSYHDHHPNH
ncbi:hypothetical protein Gpo141_00004205 [Globisporangium polare]